MLFDSKSDIVVDRKIEFDSVLADIAIDIYRLPVVCAEAERIKRAPRDWPLSWKWPGFDDDDDALPFPLVMAKPTVCCALHDDDGCQGVEEPL